MDAREAREHLEMVDRILAQAEERPVRMIPGLVIVWGFAAAAMDAGQQIAASNPSAEWGLWLTYAALAIGMAYSVGLCFSLIRCARYERVSYAERRMGSVMGAVWFTVFVAAFAQPHLFSGWAGAAVWSMGAAIMMLMTGFNGDRRGLAGGLVMLASVLAANYVWPQVPGYALAAGFIFGYALPGVLFLRQEPQERL